MSESTAGTEVRQGGGCRLRPEHHRLTISATLQTALAAATTWQPPPRKGGGTCGGGQQGGKWQAWRRWWLASLPTAPPV